MPTPSSPFIPPRGPLATRRGRLATFFCLYLTEGIPLGFTAVALAAQMRRQGLNPEQIGVFVATLYLPWAWKWLVAPVVDLIYSRRLGRRRAWIVGCQGMMILTLLAASPVNFVTHLSLLTGIILVHNAFAATMDVAIDALACTTLLEEERGAANGLMFAGAYLGNALGGAGVLFLLPYIGVMGSFGMVVGMLLAVLLFVSLRLHEPVADDEAAPRQALAEVPAYANAALRAMLGSSTAIAALCFALLPAGAYALGLALQSNLAVELGFSDQRIALLSACSTVLAAAGCVIGGLLSGRWGRRRMIALYIAATALPTLWLAWRMQSLEWIMPIDLDAPDRPAVPQALVIAFWIATLVYSLFQGLMYGTRTALFMDLCKAEVAATQFTAYMSLMNLAIAYSAAWQGLAAVKWGYPITLALDAALGCVCLLALPWIRRKVARCSATDA